MRIGLATVHTPPVRGGAEFLADGLAAALARSGHQVHRMTAPFSYASLRDCGQAMDLWETQDFGPYDGGHLDGVIALKFPATLVRHPRLVTWLLHQHRPAYDLLGTPFGFPATAEATALVERIRTADREAFSRAGKLYTIAGRVSERLEDALGIASEPVYHPPDAAERFQCRADDGFILVPSRLEALKRQSLFLEAMSRAHPQARAIIVGDGGERRNLERSAAQLGLMDRVRFAGALGREGLIELYGRCSAVFFGPRDEDYGYITLEAMLSSKPVITCTDSGGPLEFVRDAETGWIVEPTPDGVAAAIDAVFADPAGARGRGAAGRRHYEALDISWEHLVETLLSSWTKPE